ncbi:MAG: transketolase, partial [Ktedonobacteraceae bacterium]
MKELRKTIITTAARAGEGHIPSALSIIDIIWVLYDRVLRYNAADPKWQHRDRFVLSKGHGCLALYSVLAAKGFYDLTELESFGRAGSRFGGHPDCNKVPGVEASTGSLGHGLPIAVGMALGLKIRGNQERVFVLIGDGECNEGTIWESALLGHYRRLGNLTCIVDYNHSSDRALGLGDLRAKFEAFGWSTREIDGHDHDQIYDALGCHRELEGSPMAIIANTIKGNGCAQMRNNPAWHHRAPTPDELASI